MQSKTHRIPILLLSLASAVLVTACLTPRTYAVTSVTYSSSADPNDITIAELEAELAPHGQWLHVPGVGRVWRPYESVVGRSFQPYSTGGEWILTNHGWVFQSRWSWGWAPFHYGRWTMHAAHGWVWVPDTVWAPAWVDWRIGDSYVGWAPLPPAGMRIDVFGPAWVFVETRHFGVSHWHNHIIRGPRVHSVWSHTRPYRHRVNRGRVYWYSGPSRSHVRYPRVRELPPQRRHARPQPQRPAVQRPEPQRPAVQRPQPARPTPSRQEAVRPAPSPSRSTPQRNESRNRPQRVEPSRSSPSRPAPARREPARPAPSRPSPSSSLNQLRSTPVSVPRQATPSRSSTRSSSSSARIQRPSSSSRQSTGRPAVRSSSSSSRRGDTRSVRPAPSRSRGESARPSPSRNPPGRN